MFTSLFFKYPTKFFAIARKWHNTQITQRSNERDNISLLLAVLGLVEFSTFESIFRSFVSSYMRLYA